MSRRQIIKYLILLCSIEVIIAIISNFSIYSSKLGEFDKVLSVVTSGIGYNSFLFYSFIVVLCYLILINKSLINDNKIVIRYGRKKINVNNLKKVVMWAIIFGFSNIMGTFFTIAILYGHTYYSIEYLFFVLVNFLFYSSILCVWGLLLIMVKRYTGSIQSILILIISSSSIYISLKYSEHYYLYEYLNFTRFYWAMQNDITISINMINLAYHLSSLFLIIYVLYSFSKKVVYTHDYY